ncbi:MAG: winged helix-turn-helix transcriptional regulator [Candidatus Riflebacteria bacterium]|nr:winged helix-turn-helix transcriptional regulator [Candidatus Riflebacteria bacterium]
MINLVKQNPSITQRDIFGNLKVSLVSVKRTMKKLIDSQE